MAKQDDYTRYTIWVPAGLYQRVQDAAEREGRSVNAEIIATLEDAYPDPADLKWDLNVIFDMAVFSGLKAGQDLPEEKAREFVRTGRSLYDRLDFSPEFSYADVIRLLRDRYDLRLPDPEA